MKKTAPIAIAVAIAAAVAVYFLFFRGGDEAGDTTDDVDVPDREPLDKKTDRGGDRTAGNRGELAVLFDDDPEGDLVLEGQVIDSTDDPVSSAVVSIDSNPPRSVTTGEDGSFSFPELVGRRYQVVARSPVGVAGPVAVSLTETNDPVILRVKKGGEVTVTVVRAAGGEPLPGALVELRGIDVQSLSTGDDGVAKFSGVVPSFYSVVASSAGYARQSQWLRVRATGAGAEVRLGLRQGAPVSGVVVSAEGKPVAGARVLYSGASDWSQQADPRHDAVETNASGEFSFAAMPAGTFRFTARADKRAPGRSDLVTLDGSTAVDDVRVELGPGATIRGRVTDASSQPVAAARVRVSGAGGNFGGQVREAYADDQGAYEIDGLERKELEVVAIGRDASSEIVAVDLSAAPFERTVDLALEVDGVIAGVVVDGDGEPIEGGQVWAFPDWRRGGRDAMQSFRMRGVPRELTDAGGRFRLTGLSRGAYQVRASRSGGGGPFGNFTAPATDASTGDTDLRIELAAEGAIVGKVAFASGEAPAAFSVSLGGWGAGTPFSSKSGAFELPELAPRKYTIAIRGPGFDSKQLSDVEVKAGETTDLGTIEVKKGRTIAGRVVDAGGSPVAGALVRAGRTIFGDGSSSKSAFGGPPGAQNTKETRTDDGGRFAIFGLGPRDISVVAEHESLGRSPAVLIRGTLSPQDMRLELAPFGALEGTVTRDGKPAERVFVSVASMTTPDVSYGVATGDDGKFRYDKLAPDTYKVQAFLMRGMGGFGTRAPKQVEIASGETAKVELAYSGGSVELTVELTESAGKPLGFTWVTAATGPVTATNSRDLQLEIGRTPESSTQNGFSIGGSEAKLLDLSPRSYTVCAVPYPSEVSGMGETMAYSEREGDKLPVYCKPVDVAESPAEQSMTIEVTLPPFVPPGDGT
jgi:protocatechuate 3,4-dioxygenase beta subunit